MEHKRPQATEAEEIMNEKQAKLRCDVCGKELNAFVLETPPKTAAHANRAVPNIIVKNFCMISGVSKFEYMCSDECYQILKKKRKDDGASR